MSGKESQGISRAGHTVLARLMESQIWHQVVSSVWGGFRKGTEIALMPDTSVSPSMLLVPFKLLLWCWSSEGVSLIKSMHVFKRNCLELQKFLPPTQSLLVFAANVMGTYLPGTGTLD